MGGRAVQYEIAEEDALRANCYLLLARYLADVPDEEALRLARSLTGDDSSFGQAVAAFAAAARATTLDRVHQEFHDLFVGMGQGELLPYGSYYLTGFMLEKPLARLRADMARLGIARAEGEVEPEDQIASLCEMMAGLITGQFGEPADLATQRSFFDAHIGSWAPRFFEDLERARAAVFYMPLGTIGRHFVAVETQAFQMAA